MAITIFSQFQLLQTFFLQNVYAPLIAKFSSLSFTTVALLITLFFTIGIVSIFLFKKLNKAGKFNAIILFLSGISTGMKSILQLQNKWLFVTYTFAIWGSYLAMQMLAFYTIPETSHLTIKAALSCISFGSLGVIATQGGIGAYHKIIMETLKFYQIAPEFGFAYAWVSWGTQTAVMVLGGLAAFIYLPIFNKDKSSKS